MFIICFNIVDTEEIPQVQNKSSKERNESDESIRINNSTLAEKHEKFANDNMGMRSVHTNSAFSVTLARAQGKM